MNLEMQKGSVVPLPASAESISAWRREPYRIFFPLGILLAWAGVLHWLLLATGAIDQYRPHFHAYAQVEGFMTCFAVGFLFTFIPRRTGTRPPATWQLTLCALMPVAVVIACWFEKWALSQLAWLILLTVLAQFAVSRARKKTAARGVPGSFIWVFMALAMGFCGGIVAGGGSALGETKTWFYQLGKDLVLQGVFTGFVLGVGGLMIPVLTREASPLHAPKPSARARYWHLLAGGAFVGSFFVEKLVAIRLGLSLRAIVVLGELLLTAQMWKLPRALGLHRKLIWLACWMMPAGYASAAAFPQHAVAWLHVMFIGCFAALALFVGMHVALSHGGAPQLLRARPWPVLLLAVLLFFALVLRVLFSTDPAHAYRWLGFAAATFLTATLVWAAFIWRSLRPAD